MCYKVICIGIGRMFEYDYPDIKIGNLYWLYMPKDGEVRFCLFGMDDMHVCDLYINDCIYFMEVSVYRDKRIDEILL